MISKPYPLVLLFCISTVSCSRKADKSNPQLNEFKQGEYNKDQARFKNAKDRPYRVTQYDLEGAFDWEKRTLSVQQTISIDVTAEVQELRFDLTGPQVTQIKILKESGGPSTPTEATFRTLENEILIQAPQAIKSGEKVKVLANYTVSLSPDLSKSTAQKGIFLYEPVGADPVKSKVLYTASEPSSASSWMLCDDHPQRRAIFRTEFTHSKDEKFLANGDLIESSPKGALTVSSYKSRHPIPTYLMAFALGNFSCAEGRTALGTPAQYCMRKGLRGNSQVNLKKTIQQLEGIEKLLGPFPWEKYTTVLIPEFVSGGIENAGITFNHESLVDMNSYRGANTSAHELAHQWYGDYLTISTWDDLWIKEGLATFVAEEIVKPFGNSPSSTGPSFYQQPWEFLEADAILDPKLGENEKYTTGPYDRASWFFSQLRNQTGDKKFWELLRKILKDHEYSHIGTDDFLEYFLPHVRSTKDQLLNALHARELGKFNITRQGDRRFSVEFKDPTGSTLLVPEFRIVRPGDEIESTIATVGTTPLTLDLENAFATSDPNGVHGFTVFHFTEDSYVAWSEMSSLAASFVDPAKLNQILSLLNPRERIMLLQLNPDLDSNLNAFFDQSESMVESNFLLESLCFRPDLSPESLLLLNKTAKDHLSNSFYYGFSYQLCNSSFDPVLWSEFDSNPGLDEGVIAKQRALGMDFERATKVWIPMLSGEGSLLLKLHVVRGLDSKFTENTVSLLSPGEKDELKRLLEPLLPLYKNTKQGKTLEEIVGRLSMAPADR